MFFCGFSGGLCIFWGNPFGGLIIISTVILKGKNKNFYGLIQVPISIRVQIHLPISLINILKRK